MNTEEFGYNGRTVKDMIRRKLDIRTMRAAIVTSPGKQGIFSFRL